MSTPLQLVVFELGQPVALLLFGFLVSKLLLDAFCILRLSLQVKDAENVKSTFSERIQLAASEYWTESRASFVVLFMLGAWHIRQLHGQSELSLYIMVLLFCISSSLVILLLQKFTFPLNSESLEVLKYVENDRCNVGSALAHAFVYNYLAIILKNARLVEKIKDVESRCNARQNMFSKNTASDSVPFRSLEVRVKKLLLLVPSSGLKRHALLSDTTDSGIADPAAVHSGAADSRAANSGAAHSGILKASDNLQPLVIDKDGKSRRVYQNTLYKLSRKIQDEDVYFVGEFATPVSALSDMQELGDVLSAAQVKQQIRHFYSSLITLLDTHRQLLGDSCLPIYYDDSHPGAASEAIFSAIVKECFKPI